RVSDAVFCPARPPTWVCTLSLHDALPILLAEVRGRGLMIGLSFAQPGQGAMVMAELFNRRILVGFTWNNPQVVRLEPPLIITLEDRKSTRLNSSHVKSSYAVFCLKKKKRT